MEEEETYKIQNSRKIYIPIYMIIIILFGTIAFILFSGKELNIIAVQITLVFTLVLVVSTELHRFSNRFEIEPNALVHIKGILKKITRRTDLLAVSDASISQNLWQMMLGYGNVSVRVFSQDSTMPVKNINNPLKFIEILENRMSARRSSSGSRSGMGR